MAISLEIDVNGFGSESKNGNAQIHTNLPKRQQFQCLLGGWVKLDGEFPNCCALWFFAPVVLNNILTTKPLTFNKKTLQSVF